jgi:hypothetical protein
MQDLARLITPELLALAAGLVPVNSKGSYNPARFGPSYTTLSSLDKKIGGKKSHKIELTLEGWP